MITVTSIRELQRRSDEWRGSGKTIAVVPTMGFLHEGHLSLIRLAKRKADEVITTIYVNPSQFGPGEDFSRYPRDLDRDAKLAESAGTDILFTPSTQEMYPPGYGTWVEVEKLTTVLEGKFRPGHFRGVTTIVAKLLHDAKPDMAIFGQKDAQQALVIKKMVRDLDLDVDIIVAPIVREPDGLAMSSRNVYLSPDERKQSIVLHEALALGEQLIRRQRGRCSTIIEQMMTLILSRPSARIDYVSVADAATLEELEEIPEHGQILVSLAVRIGATRLIDNTIITR